MRTPSPVWPSWAPSLCFACRQPITRHDVAGELGRPGKRAGEHPKPGSRGAMAVMLYGRELARHADCLPSAVELASLLESVRQGRTAGTAAQSGG